MIPIPQYLLDVFQWLVRSSFHASILLAMILLVRAVVKGKFRFRMVYWLWMVLLLRLIWPLNLQTTFSVFNLIPKKITPEQYLSAQTAEEGPSNQDTIGLRQSEPVISDTDASSDGILVATNDAVNNTTAAPAVTFNDPMSFWCTVWLIGAEGLAAWVLFNNFRLWSIIKRERLITRQEILELLEDCKSQLGLQTVIGIVETDKVKTPCLFGYLRPRLLLPGGILDEMEQRELRYVFLHELGHLKRHDILIGWLMAVVQVLHWFNPAVWFAMAQISRDRELACDELALSSLKDGESKEYGATILTFLERFARQQRLPAMAGIAENQSLLKRRITMIAQFKNKKISWIPVIAIILLLLATTFTSAQADSDPNTAKEPSKTETANTSPSKPEMLVLDDGNSAGKRSIAGSGHAVFFETEKKSELVAVMLYGSRYGYDQPPKEKFHVWLCDMDQQVIEDFEFPYSTFKKGDPKWVKMRVKATQLPDRFYICVGFNAEQTKGVYVHYDGAASGNSYKGLPKDGFSEFEEGDWMIRAVVRPMGGNGASSSSVSSGNLQSMIDAAETGATVEIPAGTYEESIKVDKSLILKGASRDECILNVTANEPAIFIDTAGKGKVLIENLTVQWQLASSDKHEFPFAVAVKDTTAEIKNCVFCPLGNPQRSPVAIRSIGFSDMTLTGCDFTGFDYVVCYGEGTKGKIEDCFIQNCGHQGVILYSGAQAEVVGNIITGSKYHAVRTTGGKLDMRDNLIINNKNRGVYLGNKSGSGVIENNLLISNATGIDGMSPCEFRILNNVILNSEYAAIAVQPDARLSTLGNVLMNNTRGIIIHQKEGQVDPVRSEFSSNVYWNNKTDTENCEKGPKAISEQPDFIDAANGNYKITDEKFKKLGLEDPETIYYLWKKYKEKI